VSETTVNDRERDLLVVAQWLDLDQDTCAGLWMQVFVGGDPYDETADELWKKAWAFARSCATA
jgi:hypothetical protein